jgi:hypothetical protein
MREKSWSFALMLVSLLILPKMAWPQTPQQNGTLTVRGFPGQTPVLQVGGKSYVGIEALARLANGSLSFNGNQITLILPASAANPLTAPPTTTPTPSQPPTQGFSKDFLKAGIEEMSLIREWRAAIVNSVKNGYPLSDDFLATYQGQASTALRLASVAVSTDADGNAYQLLSNEFGKMQSLSNKMLAAKANMAYISPDALQNDPLQQQILTCARSLAAMAASNQFQDDGSCD